MTNEELKKKISEAKEQEWYKTVPVIFPFPKGHQSVTGLSAAYEFINQQIDGWGEYENLPDEFNQCKTYFENIKNVIVSFVNAYSQDQENSLRQRWQNIVAKYIDNRNLTPLPYNIPEIDFLIKVYQDTPNYFQGAYHSLLSNNFSLSNLDLLYGAILAYEFKLKDHTDITERRKTEKRSITKLRTDFQKYLSESEQQLATHLNDANASYADYVKKIDDLKTEKENSFTEWFNPTQKRVAELEETYKEKLKLEEPAKYWSKRATSLRWQGWATLVILLVLVGVICWSLSEILCKTPETIYASWFDNDKTAAVKWTIVYATLISFMAFVIRALSKFMFSSFHLARDCEERYTLTYFYLSLLKDSKVEDGDRQLIMQSLFSRADTGLLKEDSAPTLPNDYMKAIPK